MDIILLYKQINNILKKINKKSTNNPEKVVFQISTQSHFKSFLRVN